MDYEEKYKQALERAKYLKENTDSVGALDISACFEQIFPELHKSDDEKIRKEIIERLKWELKGAEEQDSAGCNRQKDIAMFKRGIAWLERQGEQKSWSKEDEANMDAVWKACGQVYGVKYQSILGDWLKSLKDKVQPQSKQEWSEEDEKMLDSIIDCIDGLVFIDSDQLNWLKSLKSNHWKPSEEQMSMLLAVLNDSNNITAESVHIALKSLYNDLKKL